LPSPIAWSPGAASDLSLPKSVAAHRLSAARYAAIDIQSRTDTCPTELSAVLLNPRPPARSPLRGCSRWALPSTGLYMKNRGARLEASVAAPLTSLPSRDVDPLVNRENWRHRSIGRGQDFIGLRSSGPQPVRLPAFGPLLSGRHRFGEIADIASGLESSRHTERRTHD
jgi:hypothetical protein